MASRENKKKKKKKNRTENLKVEQQLTFSSQVYRPLPLPAQPAFRIESSWSGDRPHTAYAGECRTRNVKLLI